MKIYFTASLRGKGEYGENYRNIVRAIENLGEKLVSDHITKNDFEKVAAQDMEEAKSSYSQLLNWIKKADVFVAEVSTQSLSVGHEITEAMNLNKPVVLMYLAGRRPTMLFGSGYEKLQMVEYDEKNCQTLMAKAIEEAKKYADVRFNFFVPPKILAYLDWVAKKRMIPRSVFLRNLIEREMRKDREFKE